MTSNETTDYSVGDRVRIDIPDETDPDHDRYHGEHGQIIDILEDEAGTLTGDERDSIIFRVQFSDGEGLDLRHQSIRPPIQ
jgi:ribosomal protein L21E